MWKNVFFLRYKISLFCPVQAKEPDICKTNFQCMENQYTFVLLKMDLSSFSVQNNIIEQQLIREFSAAT